MVADLLGGDTGYPSPPSPEPVADKRIPSPQQLILGAWAREQIVMAAGTSERSQQAEAGASEIGQPCKRRIGYRIAGTPVVNHADPIRALLGTGFHAAMAEGLRRLDGGMHRYLIEVDVLYRGIPGHVDVHDRVHRRATDWKTTSTRNLRRYVTDGVPPNYQVQLQIYAQGLVSQGEDVEEVALVFVPREAKSLSDIWCWSQPVDKAVADKAIDRYEQIADTVQRLGPAAVSAWPSNLCGYCPNYRAHAVDLSVACPGKGV
jgi:hypothetical protein